MKDHAGPCQGDMLILSGVLTHYQWSIFQEPVLELCVLSSVCVRALSKVDRQVVVACRLAILMVSLVMVVGRGRVDQV